MTRVCQMQGKKKVAADLTTYRTVSNHVTVPPLNARQQGLCAKVGPNPRACTLSRSTIMIRALNLFRSRATAAQSLLRHGSNAAVQKRFLSIHEHLSMGLLNKYGINTPKFLTAKDADEAYHAAQKFGGKPIVVKAQVLAGGRGKGHFDNGLQGGVHLVKTYVRLGLCAYMQS